MAEPVTNTFYRPPDEFSIDAIPYWGEAFTEARVAEDPHWRLALVCAAPSLAEAPYLAIASLPLCPGGVLPFDDNQKNSCRPSCEQPDPTTIQRLWRENRLDYDSIARIPVRNIRNTRWQEGQGPIEESVIRFALVESDIHHPIPSLCTGVQAHDFLPVPLTRPEALTLEVYTGLNSYNFSRCGPAVGGLAVGDSAVGSSAANTALDDGEYVVDYGKVRGGRAALIADLDRLLEMDNTLPAQSVEKIEILQDKLEAEERWADLQIPLIAVGTLVSGLAFAATFHEWPWVKEQLKKIPSLFRRKPPTPPQSGESGGERPVVIDLNPGDYRGETIQRMVAVTLSATLAVAAARFALRAAPVPALASLAVVGLGIYARNMAENCVK